MKTDPPIPEVPDAAAMVRVWDPFVRIFHWSLVTSFVVAWFTPNSVAGLHYWAGGAAAALVAMRVVWGVFGTRYARFAQFVRRPRTTLAYLKAIATGNEARYIGHNPAGGMMVLALIATMGLTALTGWMMTTDAFWGVAWVNHAHDLIAHGLLALVLLHLGGVALASLRHRENLVRAMLTGKKRLPQQHDID